MTLTAAQWATIQTALDTAPATDDPDLEREYNTLAALVSEALAE